MLEFYLCDALIDLDVRGQDKVNIISRDGEHSRSGQKKSHTGEFALLTAGLI